MTIQEENKELRSQIKEYEQLLDKVMKGPYQSGSIASKEHEGMYRVLLDDGKETIITANDKINKKLLKES